MRVAIVGGAGGVGASVAFNLLRMDAGHEVAILDSRPNMVTSHVMDLEQTLLLGAGDSIKEGDDEDLATADVVVVAAAVPLTVNTSRMVYLEDNAAIVGGVLDRLDAGWEGVLLVVTNPVDPLCTWALRRRGIDRRRLMGYTIKGQPAPAHRGSRWRSAATPARSTPGRSASTATAPCRCSTG
jgi:malate dehydrogenase